MANGQQVLEIAIKTILDNRGITATKDEVRQLTNDLAKVSAAGKPAETSVQGVVDAYQKLNRTGKETTSTWEQMTDAQKADQRELAQRQVRLLQNDEATKKAADASRLLGKELGALRLAGQGVNNVLNGLSQGGLSGMIQAGRGLVDISKAASAGVSMLTNVLKLVGPAALAAGAGIALMKKVAADNQKEMEAIWDAAAKNRDARTKALEENTRRVVAALKEEKEAVEAVALAYERRKAGIDQAYAREAQLDPAQDALADAKLDEAERAATAKAKTPEAKAKVKEDFRRQRESLDVRRKLVGFDNADLRAGLETQAAEEAKVAASEQSRAIQAEIDEARRARDEAVARASSFKSTGRDRRGFDVLDQSPEAVAARRKAAEAQDYLTKLEKEGGAELEKNAKTIEAADAQIEAARLTKEITALQRQAYQIIISGQRAGLASAATTAPSQEERAKAQADLAALDAATGAMANAPAANPIRDAVQAAAGISKTSGGTITANGRTFAVKDANSVEKALGEAGSAIATMTKSVGEFAQKTTADTNKLSSQLKNAKANTTGGG